jgi:hypothetical protein
MMQPCQQADRLRRQKAADHRKPEWRRKPTTATEVQAAAMLADQERWDDVDEYDGDAVTRRVDDREKRRKPRTASERQVDVILGR